MTWAGEPSSPSSSGIFIYRDDGSPGELIGQPGEILIWGETADTPEFVSQASLTGIRTMLGNCITVGKTNADHTTFASGIAEAVSLSPSDTNRICVAGIDGGLYVENLTIPQYVSVFAPRATVSGTLAIQQDTSTRLFSLRTSDANSILKTGPGVASVEIDFHYGEGNTNMAVCTGSGSILLYESKQTSLENGFGIADISTSDGHTHVNIEDLYIRAGAIGVAVFTNGSVVGRISHIVDIGRAAGISTAINNVLAGGTIDLDVGIIDCDTAWNLSSDSDTSLRVNRVLRGAKINNGRFGLVDSRECFFFEDIGIRRVGSGILQLDTDKGPLSNSGVFIVKGNVNVTGVYNINGHQFGLNDLADVMQIPTAVSGNVLGFDGNIWKPVPPSFIKSIGSSTDNGVARWDGTTGDCIQNSNVIINDTDEVFFPGLLSAKSGTFLMEARSHANVLYVSGVNEFLHEPVFCVDGPVLFTDLAAIQGAKVQPGYSVTIRSTTPGSGLYIACGDNEGDIALKITDEDMTFDILEVHTDNGQFVFGDTYSNVLASFGAVYGLDNHFTEDSADYNAQNGGYRVQGELVLDNDGNIDTFAGSLSGTINGRRDFGASAGNPVGVWPSGGDKYYDLVINEEMRYDASRAKWLSVTRGYEGAGRNGITTPGTFYRRYNGMIESPVLGAPVPKGTIVFFSCAQATAASGNLQIYVDGSVVATLVAAGSTQFIDESINVDFPSGVMSFRNASDSQSTSSAQIAVHYKLRA